LDIFILILLKGEDGEIDTNSADVREIRVDPMNERYIVGAGRNAVCVARGHRVTLDNANAPVDFGNHAEFRRWEFVTLSCYGCKPPRIGSAITRDG
jgi:hypothetical protein